MSGGGWGRGRLEHLQGRKKPEFPSPRRREEGESSNNRCLGDSCRTVARIWPKDDKGTAGAAGDGF